MFLGETLSFVAKLWKLPQVSFQPIQMRILLYEMVAECSLLN